MASSKTGNDLKSNKQACDPCKARKVRCNRESRCQQCCHLGLRCTYSASKQRRSNIDRGRHLRQWKSQSTKGSALLAPLSSTDDPASDVAATKTLLPVPDPAALARFLPAYEQSVYPFHPIISLAEAVESMNEMQTSQEARAFCYALAAIAINLTCTNQVHEQLEPWISAAMHLQQPLLNVEQITARRLITVQWIHVCLMGMQKLDLAYFYLRQATSMIQMLHVDSDDKDLSTSEKARRQRLYWLIFVHERFGAISFQWNVILPPLKSPPIMAPDIPAKVEFGFRQIYRLFSIVDADLLVKWNPSPSDPTQVITREWIEAKHHAIENESILSYYGEGDKKLSDDQIADLIITKHWLHMILWQIAVSQCLLSSSAKENHMSLLFPIRISSQLRSTLSNMPKEMFTIHGSCMQQKLFEITDTIGKCAEHHTCYLDRRSQWS
ncbi:hypothetical protein MRB53_039368 [Persea americana]|nr:hypothetical protein MRB53_039368 [Persea americana]